MGEGLNKPLFSRRCLQAFYIFLSRALADIFEKNERERENNVCVHGEGKRRNEFAEWHVAWRAE